MNNGRVTAVLTTSYRSHGSIRILSREMFNLSASRITIVARP